MKSDFRLHVNIRIFDRTSMYYVLYVDIIQFIISFPHNSKLTPHAEQYGKGSRSEGQKSKKGRGLQ